MDDFQEGLIDVLVCTFGVGSVGLTLTRSHRVILMDRPWTPGDVMQAEDRIRRIGQKHHEIYSYWITSFDFDERLDKLLESKEANSHKVLTDKVKRSWFDKAPRVSKSCLEDKKESRRIEDYFIQPNSSASTEWNVDFAHEDHDNAGGGVMKLVFRQLVDGL